EGEGLAVAPLELVGALEEAAVDEDPLLSPREERAAPGDGAAGAEERDIGHGRPSYGRGRGQRRLGMLQSPGSGHRPAMHQEGEPTMKHRVAAFAAAVLVCAAPAFAGMTFEATTTTDGPQGKQVMRTQAW